MVVIKKQGAAVSELKAKLRQLQRREEVVRKRLRSTLKKGGKKTLGKKR